MPLDHDPTNKYTKNIDVTLKRGAKNREIDSEIAEDLIVTYPSSGRFYILPKIHQEGNPGRPIVSGNGSPTEMISKFVDHNIQDLIKLLPSHIQDDMDFLRKIRDINTKGPLPPITILCTMEVTGLCTNIPHSEGIDACCETFETWKGGCPKSSATFICYLI